MLLFPTPWPARRRSRSAQSKILIVASQGIHTKLLNQAAQEILVPLGLMQRGPSRMWFHDHGWWLVVVSFESSSWSKGSCLDVAAMWLWDRKDFVSFDVGGRVEQFVSFQSEAQFAPEVRRLALSARKHVLRLREQFLDVSRTARFLHRYASKFATPWPMFHAAMSLGYAGETYSAEQWFKKLDQTKAVYVWHKALQDTAREFAGLLHDSSAFRGRVREEILATRKLLKLPEREELALFD